MWYHVYLLQSIPLILIIAKCTGHMEIKPTRYSTQNSYKSYINSFLLTLYKPSTYLRRPQDITSFPCYHRVLKYLGVVSLDTVSAPSCSSESDSVTGVSSSSFSSSIPSSHSSSLWRCGGWTDVWVEHLRER